MRGVKGNFKNAPKHEAFCFNSNKQVQKEILSHFDQFCIEQRVQRLNDI